MPYIKPVDRTKFAHSISEVLGILKDDNDTLYHKGEYIGYFLHRAVKRYLADPGYTQNTFNSAHFNQSKQKTLANAADSIAALISRADPIAGAGELNYALSAVLWGYLGEADDFPFVGYGMRAYITGIIDRVKSTVVDGPKEGMSPRDATMAFRRHLVIRGVLQDIMTETYRRTTGPYEDAKLAENGDVWVDGKLHVPQETTDVISV